MTSDDAAQQKMWRDIAEIKRNIAELQAIYGTHVTAAAPSLAPSPEPADAQTVDLRFHASSSSQVFIRNCACNDDGCACEDKAFH